MLNSIVYICRTRWSVTRPQVLTRTMETHVCTWIWYLSILHWQCKQSSEGPTQGCIPVYMTAPTPLRGQSTSGAHPPECCQPAQAENILQGQMDLMIIVCRLSNCLEKNIPIIQPHKTIVAKSPTWPILPLQAHEHLGYHHRNWCVCVWIFSMQLI